MLQQCSRGQLGKGRLALSWCSSDVLVKQPVLLFYLFIYLVLVTLEYLIADLVRCREPDPRPGEADKSQVMQRTSLHDML